MLAKRECKKIYPLLWGYAETTLAPAERMRVESHLHRCPACARQAAAYQATVRLMQAGRDETLLSPGATWQALRQHLKATAGTAASQERPLSALSVGDADRTSAGPARGPAYVPRPLLAWGSLALAVSLVGLLIIGRERIETARHNQTTASPSTRIVGPSASRLSLSQGRGATFSDLSREQSLAESSPALAPIEVERLSLSLQIPAAAHRLLAAVPSPVCSWRPTVQPPDDLYEVALDRAVPASLDENVAVATAPSGRGEGRGRKSEAEYFFGLAMQEAENAPTTAGGWEYRERQAVAAGRDPWRLSRSYDFETAQPETPPEYLYLFADQLSTVPDNRLTEPTFLYGRGLQVPPAPPVVAGLQAGVKVRAAVKHRDIDEALLKAVRQGDKAKVKALLAKGANTNAFEGQPLTPLIAAASASRPDLAQLLLGAGAHIDGPDDQGQTALIATARSALNDMVRLLLEKGANIEARDKAGLTALGAVASQGEPVLTEELLKQGAKVNAMANDGSTVLMSAANSGRLEVTQLLLENGADINAQDGQGNTALIQAAGADAAVVKALLAHGAAVEARNSFGETALFAAARNRQFAMVQTLLDRGARIDARDRAGKTALIRAAEWDQADTVAFLLARGADINAQDNEGKTALYWAAYLGHAEPVKRLVAGGARVDARDKEGETPLVCASRQQHFAILPLLLEKGADVNAQNKQGETALLWLANAGQDTLVRRLLDFNAEVDLKDAEGKTAVMVAAQRGDAGTLQVLLKHGADPNACDSRDVPVIFYAAENENVGCVRLLLDSGAEINTRYAEGMTVLTAALAGGPFTLPPVASPPPQTTPVLEETTQVADLVVTYLVERGADVNISDDHGLTPLMWAAMREPVAQESLTDYVILGWREETPHLRREDVATVKFLLEKGADAHARDHQGRTALTLAKCQGHQAVAALLAGVGAKDAKE